MALAVMWAAARQAASAAAARRLRAAGPVGGAGMAGSGSGFSMRARTSRVLQQRHAHDLARPRRGGLGAEAAVLDEHAHGVARLVGRREGDEPGVVAVFPGAVGAVRAVAAGVGWAWAVPVLPAIIDRARGRAWPPRRPCRW